MDENILSSDTGEDPPPPSSHHGKQKKQKRQQQQQQQRPHSATGNPNYPWIQMALPGGGIVSVPVETSSAASGERGSKDGGNGSRGLASPDLSEGGGLAQPLQPVSAVGSAGPVSCSASGPPSVSGGAGTRSDLLTVAAGEPVTHFNLDQLLEIVQSFQLDTTMAGHDEVAHRDLALGVGPLGVVSRIMQSAQNNPENMAKRVHGTRT